MPPRKDSVHQEGKDQFFLLVRTAASSGHLEVTGTQANQGKRCVPYGGKIKGPRWDFEYTSYRIGGDPKAGQRGIPGRRRKDARATGGDS